MSPRTNMAGPCHRAGHHNRIESRPLMSIESPTQPSAPAINAPSTGPIVYGVLVYTLDDIAKRTAGAAPAGVRVTVELGECGSWDITDQLMRSAAWLLAEAGEVVFAGRNPYAITEAVQRFQAALVAQRAESTRLNEEHRRYADPHEWTHAKAAAYLDRAGKAAQGAAPRTEEQDIEAA